MTASTDTRVVRAPRGIGLHCLAWPQEAAFRMIQNNLDPDVAERPDELIVYGGTGRAARSWQAFDRILATLKRLKDDETLLVQSGKPVRVFRTHEWAPRVLISNAMLVPKWATWEEFRALEAMGLTMYGQMTAGSWIYIDTQGILQSSDPCDAEAAEGRRDAPRAIGEARRRLPHARVGAAGADLERDARPEVGDLGGIPGARGDGPDDVRADDRRIVDLHRHPGHPPELGSLRR